MINTDDMNSLTAYSAVSLTKEFSAFELMLNLSTKMNPANTVIRVIITSEYVMDTDIHWKDMSPATNRNHLW
jgi:hypothetical protein